MAQLYSELLAVQRARAHGDSAWHYLAGDPYNAVQVGGGHL